MILALALVLPVLQGVVFAQERPEVEWDIRPLRGGATGEQGFVGNIFTGEFVFTNGVMVKYGDAVLTAERVAGNHKTGVVVADGQVRVQQGEQVWASEHLRYNFFTHQMEAEQFRTGETPFFATGRGLHAELTNHVYVGTNAMLTADDVAEPFIKVRATRIRIVPGKKFEAYNAVLYLGDVPVFYFPYYTCSLKKNANNFNFVPGYRSVYGPFILGTYSWYLSPEFSGVTHVDYREKRGPGAGQDFTYNFGRWGEGTFKYYYTHDKDSNVDDLGVPIPENRQRVYFSYQANPATNLYVKSLVRYESDLAVTRDFFETEYRRDPQPDTYVDANKFWQNFSVDVYVQPRVNNFLETVERLPDVRITGYRQEIGATPLYYESQSSIGYYRRVFAEDAGTNGPPPGLNYEAARADTFHQILLPETLFGWLNVTPRVGGRLTYYSQATGPGATTDDEYRGVFNTGAEVSFKASRVWPGAESKAFEVDGLRHILEPSANYVYVPAPSTAPAQLPQFDYELPSLRLLPIDFPDYTAIDSIDSQNVVRWGLRNKLQTKREGAVVNLVNWDVYTDWRIKPRPDQTTFADIYSDLTIRPRSWLTLESLVRYGPNDGQLHMSYTTVTIRPNDVWSWSLGQYYLRDDFTSPLPLGEGNNVFSSTMYYRLNENWGLRMAHYFDARSGKMQEQSYSVYRDMRSWTGALSFLVRQNVTGPVDYTVAFTFSLKAYPRISVGGEAGAGPYSLLGG